MASTKSATTTSNGTGRLPSTRERRPALAALAVLLILGGAVASAWLAMQAGNRAEFVQVSSNVGQGEEISESDLTTVELPEGFEDGVPESDRDDLVGQYTTTPWTPGMVVTESMVTDKDKLDDKFLVFSVPVDAALAPKLSAGTNIVVFTGGNKSVGGTVASDATTGDSDIGSGEASVVVSIPTDCGTDIATALGED
ncbi:MAG: SAF domain-containing protein, partial [Actinomycetia bacterium]|nr:SAF domain-containing protein [Actinomycetes bacterium]